MLRRAFSSADATAAEVFVAVDDDKQPSPVPVALSSSDKRKCLKSSLTVDVDDHSDVFNGYPSILWDWPFSHKGVARCRVVDNKFNVALDFSYLESTRQVEVKRCENLKTNGICWTVGLCAITEDSDNTFWRLEIEVIRNLNLVLIEAYREMNRDQRHCKTTRKLRKMFQLPKKFDINTLRTSLSPENNGCILLEADLLSAEDRNDGRRCKPSA